jgi:hypothetical protein
MAPGEVSMLAYIERLGLALLVSLAVVGAVVAPARAQDQPAEGGGGDEPAPADPSTAEPAPADPAPAEPPAAGAPGGDGMPSSDGMGSTEDEDLDASLEEKPDEGAAKLGVGVRVRYVSMPSAILDLFVEFSQPMSSVGFALEVVRRKRDFDIVFGLESEKTSPDDGFWGEKGETPGQPGENPDFVQFDNFGLVSLDASFVWHKNFNEYVALRYGAGIGAGLVLGTIYQTDTECTRVGDVSSCSTPVGAPREESEDVPPVVPIVNLLLGVRIKANDNLSFNIEGGFRDMFYFGAGGNYFF